MFQGLWRHSYCKPLRLNDFIWFTIDSYLVLQAFHKMYKQTGQCRCDTNFICVQYFDVSVRDSMPIFITGFSQKINIPLCTRSLCFDMHCFCFVSESISVSYFEPILLLLRISVVFWLHGFNVLAGRFTWLNVV